MKDESRKQWEKDRLELDMKIYGMPEADIYPSVRNHGFPPKEVLRCWIGEAQLVMHTLKERADAGESIEGQFDYVMHRINKAKFILDLTKELVIADLEYEPKN